MTNIICPKGCCMLAQIEYSLSKTTMPFRGKRIKAGVFIYDPVSKSVLLVQSKGNLWGSPKGTMALCDKTFTDCALREVKEETGLDINICDFSNFYVIQNTSFYFYVEMPKCDVYIQSHIQDNDANGIGWIKIDCLIECVESELLDLNHHFCIICMKFLGIKISRKM